MKNKLCVCTAPTLAKINFKSPQDEKRSLVGVKTATLLE